MDKLTELLEEHSIHLDSCDAVIFGCPCGWGNKIDTVTVELHREHLAEMLKPLLAEVWYEGMAATKLATLGIRPARNPYETEQ